MSVEPTGTDSAKGVPQDNDDTTHQSNVSSAIAAATTITPQPVPIKSKSTSNLPTMLDSKPLAIPETDVMSSVTTPIHPLHSHHGCNLIDLDQEELNIPLITPPPHQHPQSIHSIIPPLPTQDIYSPIGHVILRYLERWILELIERHRNGPYFYPIAITLAIIVVVLVLILVFSGNFNALVRILRHLICELIQLVKPSSTVQFCV